MVLWPGEVKFSHLSVLSTGSRNGPFSRCSIAARLSRLTQGMLCPQSETKVQVFDDPAVSIRGDSKRRKRIIRMITAAWVI